MTNSKLNHLDIDYVRSCFPTFKEPLAAKPPSLKTPVAAMWQVQYWTN